MRYLFDHMNEFEENLRRKNILLMLDFDGTLAPIAPTPGEAVLPDETRRELVRLAESPSCSVWIISGRALNDIRAKVGIPGIAYVGNHGLEIVRPNEEPQSVDMPQFQIMLERLKEELAAKLAPFPGAIVEDKERSLAVHYRTVVEEDRSRIKAVVYETVKALGGEREMRLCAGAMVLEIRPPDGCDKGTIVSSLLQSEGLLGGDGNMFAVYIGDDATDEDAFTAMKGRGLAVLVGAPRISHAECYLVDPGEVRAFLRFIAG